jgi:hypothetical protein
MGFDQTSNASAVRWGFDPFLEECDRNVTLTHGLGGPCYGWKKPGDAPGDSPFPSSRDGMYPGDFV